VNTQANTVEVVRMTARISAWLLCTVNQSDTFTLCRLGPLTTGATAIPTATVPT